MKRTQPEWRSPIRVVPATAERWPDVGKVFGPREKNPMSCWCQRFRRHEEADNRDALEQEIRFAAAPVGLLAYNDQADGPVGWTRVVPRSTLPGIEANRAIMAVVGDVDDGWWVSCFAVRREWRGRGVGVALLETAVQWAAQRGAAIVDGHPVDVAMLTGTPSPTATFTGTLTMFERAGFHEIGRTYKSRPVMRRVIKSTP